MNDVHDFPAVEFTDTGNAARFAQINAVRVRYVGKWGTWLVYEGGRFIEDDRGIRTGELAKEVGRAILAEAAETRDDTRRDKLVKWGGQAFSAARIRAMIELARGIDGTLVGPDHLDADPYLLNVLNGTLDLRSGLIRPADPADLLTKQCPVAWDLNAEAPRFQRALTEWFPDPELRAYVQRIVGASLVGCQQDHVFIIHFGPGGNGKGTFIRLLLVVLGPYAVTPHMSLLVQLRHAEHDTVKAVLFRARLAVAAETERRVKLAEASVKNLTGRDRITCRRLYENPWEFEPSHSLWLQTNYLPEIAGRDRGMWRRIRVVPWLNSFERDKGGDLDAQLAAEAPGVLRWAVEGALLWGQHGLEEPEAVIRATLDYRTAEDAFTRFAAENGLTFAPGLEVPVKTLSDIWDEWAAAEGIEHSKKDFNDYLRDNGAKRRQHRADGRARCWSGAGIVEAEQAVSPVSPSRPVTFSSSTLHGKSPENPVTVVTGNGSEVPRSYPCSICHSPTAQFQTPGVVCFKCRQVEKVAGAL